MILENLISGEAHPQTVALMEHEHSGQLLGLASVRMNGNQQVRTNSATPWFLRRLAVNPYVNLIARDERYRNTTLADGRTRLGEALVRAALEVVQAQAGQGEMPTVWALVRRHNEASKRALRRLAFYPHDRSCENQQDVFVRRSGRILPSLPDPEVYRGAQHEREGAEEVSERRL